MAGGVGSIMGGVHVVAGGCAGMLNPKPSAAGMAAGTLGEVTVCPHVGQGPLIPAMWEGTVSKARQDPHSNWMTSDINTQQCNYS